VPAPPKSTFSIRARRWSSSTSWKRITK
jgi:hypothetical protein